LEGSRGFQATSARCAAAAVLLEENEGADLPDRRRARMDGLPDSCSGPSAEHAPSTGNLWCSEFIITKARQLCGPTRAPQIGAMTRADWGKFRLSPPRVVSPLEKSLTSVAVRELGTKCPVCPREADRTVATCQMIFLGRTPSCISMESWCHSIESHGQGRMGGPRRDTHSKGLTCAKPPLFPNDGAASHCSPCRRSTPH
jgi:hypothetical protein